MGKLILTLTPFFGIGGLRYSNFIANGKAELRDGKTVDVESSKWNPDVQVILKKSFIDELSIPSDVKVIIEWEDENQE